MIYNVTARRWAHGWELHVENVGVTQCHRLSGARRMAADYVWARTDQKATPEDINLTVELGDAEDAEVTAVRAATRAAAQAQEEAAERARALARHLEAAGLAQTEIAVVMGVSAQRVGQLLKSGDERKAAA